MKKQIIFGTLLLFICFSGISQSFRNSNSSDPFGSRVFIENRGQFDKAVPGSKVFFAYENSGEKIYFTENGPVYKIIKYPVITERDRERAERGKTPSPKKEEIEYIFAHWENVSPGMEMVTEEKQSHYFTYGSAELNSSTFKKIIYKNIYENIDIEYFFPEERIYGVKYNVILHPGADPSKLKILYKGDIRKIKLEHRNAKITTENDGIIEHEPLSFYQDGSRVKCEFTLNEQTLGFNFPEGFQNDRTLVIDPWVTTITTLSNGNYGFDVDYDLNGNLFVYGGVDQAKVAKYDPAGTLLWTFSGSVPSLPWTSQGVGNSYLGNFVVNKITGKTYIGQGYEPANGARIIRLDANGNYDNFVTPILNTVEVWDFAYYCPGDKVYELGGATTTNLSGGILNQATGTVQVANFTGIPTTGQDILSSAIDDQGNIFAIMASLGTQAVNNKMIRINNSFNGNVWFVPSTFNTFVEAANKQNYVGGSYLSNGYNCLAANNNYLFYYDGNNIAAYDKNNGSLLGTLNLPMLVPRQQGGIAVDDCNTIYIGGIDNLFSYSFNGNTFSALPSVALSAPSPNKYVYDIKLDRNNKKLFVCGSGFVGVYSAINSLNCGGNVNISTSCSGVNNAVVTASVNPGVLNPVISYIWTSGATTLATTMNSTLSTNSVTLANGVYTLITQANAPCGPTFINTFSIACCPNVTLTPVIAQQGCAYAVNSATINVAGAGSLVPTVSWSPQPATVNVNPLTASGLSVGITSATVALGIGCYNTVTMSVLAQAPPVTFTLNNLSGTYSITCTNTVVNLQAVSNYTYGSLSYSWTSLSFTAGTSSVSVFQPNTMTVTVADPLSGCFSQQTVAIGINTVVPTANVSPSVQAISCVSTAPVTFSGTVTNPTSNIQQDWYSPLNPLPGGLPIASSNNSLSLMSGSVSPGVYSLQVTNLVNGCKTIKTVTVTSLDAWPTFSVNSPTNFSVGCAPLNQTTISIVNPVSTQTPPSTCSFTFLPPTFTGAVTPSIVLGISNSTITTVPGTWTVIVQDNSNFCRTSLVVPVIQNTVTPDVGAILPTYTLLCKTPTILATGTSSTSNTVISWLLPISPPNLSQPTLVIGTPGVGPNTSSTSLNYANYTVVATNSVNACMSTSVINIYQNFKPPVSSPTISIGTATAIYCTAAQNPVVLTTGNSTTTSGGGPTAFVANPCWQGPSPQTPTCGPSTYSCYVPGTYSLTVMDNYNGCEKTATINVIDKTQPPVLINPFDTAYVDCGSNHAVLNLSVLSPSGGIRYWFTMYPNGTAFSPTNAIISNGGNPALSGTSSSTVSVSQTGLYFYLVTNTLTGCKANGIFTVIPGGLSCDMNVEPENGIAPLTINFSAMNCDQTAPNNYIWNFGNGSSSTAGSNVSSEYLSAGTYTVMMLAQKGDCLDTVYKTLRVDMPSKLEIPNIFTPNNDGSNDFFFLKASGLSNIHAVITDRWGNKVYEVNSSSGNILWDGKNLNGKECSDGVYFYVITADGKDSQHYQQKGNVSLFR